MEQTRIRVFQFLISTVERNLLSSCAFINSFIHCILSQSFALSMERMFHRRECVPSILFSSLLCLFPYRIRIFVSSTGS